MTREEYFQWLYVPGAVEHPTYLPDSSEWGPTPRTRYQGFDPTILDRPVSPIRDEPLIPSPGITPERRRDPILGRPVRELHQGGLWDPSIYRPPQTWPGGEVTEVPPSEPGLPPWWERSGFYDTPPPVYIPPTGGDGLVVEPVVSRGPSVIQDTDALGQRQYAYDTALEDAALYGLAPARQPEVIVIPAAAGATTWIWVAGIAGVLAIYLATRRPRT